jgi:hypothetical protein
VLRQKYPFVAATAEDRVKKAAQNWLDFNKDALKKDPSLIDRASMDVDLQDSGTPQRYPVRTVLQQAGFQPVAGLNGESLTAADCNDVSGRERIRCPHESGARRSRRRTTAIRVPRNSRR